MKNSPIKLQSYAWQRLRATALHERIFIVDMLNPSLKSRFMQEFGRILAGLVGYKISPLKNKKRTENKKTFKNGK